MVPWSCYHAPCGSTPCMQRWVSFDPQASQPDTRIQCVGNCKPTQRHSWHLANQHGHFIIMPLSLVENHATVIQSLFYGPRTERPSGSEIIAQHNCCAHAHKHACELSKTGCETAFSSAEEFSPLSVAQSIGSRLLMGDSCMRLNDQSIRISIPQTATDTAISQAGHKMLLFSQYMPVFDMGTNLSGG